MKRSRFGLRLGVLALTFGASGWVNAACYIGSETNATSTQADSGNGTYSCSVVSTGNGTLADVTSQITLAVQGDGTVTWSVPVDTNGYPTVDVDLVSVSSNSGKRCNYNYADQKAGGAKLTTSDLSTAKYVTVCADGVIAPAPLPEPPAPYSTYSDNCTATFANTSPDGKFDVAIGYTKNFFEGGLEGAAICAGPGQKQCVNECVPRDTSNVVCQPDANGRLPLACAACEYGTAPGTSLNYCWYYENHVNLTTQTFKPSPKKKSLSAQIDVTTGSDCYTVTVGPMYGGKTYSYQYCPTTE